MENDFNTPWVESKADLSEIPAPSRIQPWMILGTIGFWGMLATCIFLFG